MPDTAASTFQILVQVANFAFPFWPMLLLSPLGGRKQTRVLRGMLVMWGFVAILRGLSLFSPTPIPAFFIPEPNSTKLFLVTGAILFTLHIVLTVRKRRQFAQKTGGIRTVNDLLKLSPVEFEDMVVALYEAAGHQAKRTGQTGDHGVDVVVQAKNDEKWVIQCKRWRGMVGEPIIRDFYGVMHHEKAHRGIVITSGRFSRPALKWAKGKPLALYNGERFLHLWHKTQAKKKPQPSPTLSSIKTQPKQT